MYYEVAINNVDGTTWGDCQDQSLIMESLFTDFEEELELSLGESDNRSQQESVQ